MIHWACHILVLIFIHLQSSNNIKNHFRGRFYIYGRQFCLKKGNSNIGITRECKVNERPCNLISSKKKNSPKCHLKEYVKINSIKFDKMFSSLKQTNKRFSFSKCFFSSFIVCFLHSFDNIKGTFFSILIFHFGMYQKTEKNWFTSVQKLNKLNKNCWRFYLFLKSFSIVIIKNTFIKIS